MLREILQESGLDPRLKKEMVKMIKKILDTEEKLKKEAERLDRKYEKETGKSFFFNYIHNGKHITKDDIKFLEDK
jgi:hypothetical protein